MLSKAVIVATVAATIATASIGRAQDTAAASNGVNVVRLQRAVRDSGRRSNWLNRHAPEFAQQRAKKYASSGSGTDLPAEGSIWPTSIFWTTVQVGTPLRSFAVAIDSGSPRLFLSGKNCNGCVTTFPNRPYDPAASSSSKVDGGQTFNYTYETCDPTQPLQPCTITGPYYTDVVSLAGYGPAPILLGKIEEQTANFYQFHTIDGIMGMVSSQWPDPGNVFQALCIRGGFCKPVWAICMREGLVSNGTMTIGGVDERLSDGPIQYVPSSNETAWHEVFVNNFTVHAAGSTTQTTIVANQHAILDTGTNDVLLPTSVFAATKEAICGTNNSAGLAHCEALFAGTSCFDLSDAEVAAYPTLRFRLQEGVELRLDSRDYLLKGSPAASSAGQYCFGLSDGGDFFIFGDSIMQNYYLVFEEQRIGWGPVNLDNCGSV